MKLMTCLATALAVTIAASSATGRAQQPATSALPSSLVDPDAMAALDRMGAYLRTLTAFQVQATTSREVVLDSGLKQTSDGTVDLLVRRPNRLRAEISNDAQHRMFFYDGKSFSIWARRANYYAVVPAPPTLSQLVDRLADKYDIEMPLVDLFYWGTDKSSKASDIKVAIDIGASQVQGTSCEQYAFRQDGLDWQIWLQSGEFPLPRKLVLTTTSDEARPQYTSVMTWMLAPAFNDAAFVFDPPSGVQKITLTETAGGER